MRRSGEIQGKVEKTGTDWSKDRESMSRHDRDCADRRDCDRDSVGVAQVRKGDRAVRGSKGLTDVTAQSAGRHDKQSNCAA
jgi:hypothetical protein